MRLEAQDLIEFVLWADGGLSRGAARKVSSYFTSVGEFLACTREQLTGLRSASGMPLRIDGGDIEKILQVSSAGILSEDLPLVDSYIRGLARDFTRRQVENINSLGLESLNINPLLIRSLNLKTPLEVLEFNVSAAVSRSIVTSMGYFVQNLLEVTSEEVERVRSGWDLVKHGSDGKNHWIQVKSGTNDMDKDQIIYWLHEIQKVEGNGDNGYIGMTYGKRGNSTVTLSLMRTYLPDMEIRTLVGRELWDFLSGDDRFHVRLFDSLRVSAAKILGSRSIQEEIERKIRDLLAEFEERYGGGEEGVRNYIDDIF